MQYGQIMNAVAASGTNTIKSSVVSVAKAATRSGPAPSLTFTTQTTGTLTGALSVEVNNMSDNDYAAAVRQAAGATYEAKEAANTTGWMQHDLTPSATIAITGVENNDIDLGVFAYARTRLSYTNATNTGALSAWFCAG